MVSLTGKRKRESVSTERAGQANSPKCIGVTDGVSFPSGRGASARRGARVLARTVEGASGSQASAAVAARVEHGGRAERDVLARGAVRGGPEPAQLVHAHLVGLHLVVREVSRISP